MMLDMVAFESNIHNSPYMPKNRVHLESTFLKSSNVHYISTRGPIWLVSGAGPGRGYLHGLHPCQGKGVQGVQTSLFSTRPRTVQTGVAGKDGYRKNYVVLFDRNSWGL
jgi:hypothetical protein